MKRNWHILFLTLAILIIIFRAPAQTVTNLGIVPAGRLMYVFWPAGDTNYVLQKAASANSTTWTTVTSGLPLMAVCLTNTSPGEYFRLYLNTNIPPATVQIPGGAFTMGDTLDGEADAVPTNVTVSGYYIDMNLVSYGQWQSVYDWATAHGYGFVDAGAGKATNYPVESVDWYDAVKWSNARSQQAGLKPGITRMPV